VNVSIGTDRDLVVPIQYAYLDVFGTRLDDFEQAFDRQFDRLLLRHIIFVVFLQELSYSLGRTTNGVGLIYS
jgi:hypothetical protein